MKEKRLGEILVSQGVVSEGQVAEGLDSGGRFGLTLGQALVMDGECTEQQIAEALAAKFGLERVSLAGFQVDAALLARARRRNVERLRIIPMTLEQRDGHEVLAVATAHPEEMLLLDELRAATGLTLDIRVTTETEISEALCQIFGQDDTQPSSRMDVIDVVFNQFARGADETLLLCEGEVPAVFNATTRAHSDGTGPLSVEEIADLSQLSSARRDLTHYPPIEHEILAESARRIIPRDKIDRCRQVGGIIFLRHIPGQGRFKVTVSNWRRARSAPGSDSNPRPLTIRFDRITRLSTTPPPIH